MLRELIKLPSIIEIVIFFFIFYSILRFIRGTKALEILKATIFLIAISLLGVLLVTEQFHLTHLKQFLQIFLSGLFIAVIIIFTPEIRRGLLQISQTRILLPLFRVSRSEVIGEITNACYNLAGRKVGAMIVIEREVGLGEYIANAVRIYSIVSSELLEAIFYPGTPTHDGAVIIQRDKIAAAGCLFPLTENPTSKSMGTRHRAAVGITEESDAIAIVVSEETGRVSLCVKGEIKEALDKQALEKMMQELYVSNKKGEVR